MKAKIMASTQFNVRIDTELKGEAEAILGQLGLSPADYTRMAFRQLVNHRGVPFSLKVPNAETQAAIDAPKNEAISFTSLEDMHAHIDSMADED